MASRISDVFDELQAQGRMAFMPFVTAGDPDLPCTQRIIQELQTAQVDLIEIGFPYSDPIADGPVIQASYTRALNAHVSVPQILAAISELDTAALPPLVGMVSYAIVFRVGLERFLQDCKESGIAGLIIPDLPGAEADAVFRKVREAELDLIQLVAPTTPRSRVKQILECCSGFVYCIAVAGTTGERSEVAAALLDQLVWLKEETNLPLAVGFGISKPEHVAALQGLSDGVIVGSAIVRHLQTLADGASSEEELLSEIARFAQAMTAAAHQTPV